MRRKASPPMPRATPVIPSAPPSRAPRPAGGANLRRKSTNVTLAVSLVSEAKTLGVNISQAAEAGVAQAVALKRAEVWLAENREALESSNAFAEAHGLPLARYRGV